MTQKRTTKTYEGLFPSQARDRFRADATEAARHGWHPVDERWNGQALTVTYEQRPGPTTVGPGTATKADVTVDPPSTPAPTARGWAKVTLGALAAIVALILVTLVGGSMRAPVASTGPTGRGASTIRVSAAEYGSVWPLTVEGGVLSCETYMEVVLTTADGRSYGVNGSARGDERWIDVETIYRRGVVGFDTSFLIELGLGLCED